MEQAAVYWGGLMGADCFNFHESLATQVEERQFQGYANKVIAEAESRGANTQPLRKAAKAGTGQ